MKQTQTQYNTHQYSHNHVHKHRHIIRERERENHLAQMRCEGFLDVLRVFPPRHVMIDNRPQRFATVHNGSQRFASVCVWTLWPYQWQVLQNLSMYTCVLCGRRSGFARSCTSTLHFSWQVQRFGVVHAHFACQAQHFRPVLPLVVVRKGFQS